MRDTVGRRASLAGWLFADLSLVLAILFIGSTTSTEERESAPPPTSTPATTTTDSSTTTTTAPSNPEGNSLNVEPIKVIVSITDPDNELGVQKSLESALRSIRKLKKSTRFGVVIVHGGTGGDPDLRGGKSRATRAAISLNSWERLTTKRWIWGDQAFQGLRINQYQFTLLEDLTTAGD